MTLLPQKQYQIDQHTEATLVDQFFVQSLGQLSMQINMESGVGHDDLKNELRKRVV